MSNAVDIRTLEPVSEPLTPVSRQERKLRTRQTLLDTALELLADRPFATLSLREVAKGAGIVPTAFYRHFASMEDLGVALVEEATRTLRGMIRSARTDPDTYQGMISASVTTLHQFVRVHEDHFRFLTRERYAGGPLAQAIGVELRLFSGDLAIDLARFPKLREWSTEDLHMLADLIVSVMLTTIVELLEARPGEDGKITGTAEKRLRLVLLGVPHWKSS
ncbi:TetR family transcriptional regulator [Amycolatopsis balhimycina DSM 5908]|uniref:TetR family transcriptional regulator n=1 Tax=Amycolatopsis balhimycina DSM 5908 TaxID=1081091 RepID=A0A428WAS2_AMYBA|nr:TetR family transcriptional regulator [Amycolatopsis balhimycina]RSM40208.1 TetR family transcriptional regulator [Amycolatopsis balhimycina DSM 5908]